jgi:hypothetical protein
MTQSQDMPDLMGGDVACDVGQGEWRQVARPECHEGAAPEAFLIDAEGGEVRTLCEGNDEIPRNPLEFRRSSRPATGHNCCTQLVEQSLWQPARVGHDVTEAPWDADRCQLRVPEVSGLNDSYKSRVRGVT